MKEDMTEETTEGFSWEQLKPLYAGIFDQLVGMPAFTEWFATNCDIDIHVDDAEERIMVQIKSLSVRESTKRMMALQKAKMDDEPLIIEPPSGIIV